MNREIKFRAWTKDHWIDKGMLYDYQDTIYTDSCFWNEFPIMQFTGLKDKKGNEIYEGDILLCHEYDSSDIGGKIIQTFKNAVVGFEDGSFYYYPKGNMKQPHQLLMYAYLPEIIGNIYENQELLNK